MGEIKLFKNTKWRNFFGGLVGKKNVDRIGIVFKSKPAKTIKAV
jgi:hypothetical protein